MDRRSQNKLLGYEGERIARQYLESKGYSILDTNWYDGDLEIDIIAEYKNQIIFVEVKTASYKEKRDMSLFVNRRKQKFMIQAMKDYFVKKKLERVVKPRFDIITILMQPTNINLKHIKGAFHYVD